MQMCKASPNKLINEIEVFGDGRLNNKLLKTIEHCYKRAPFFGEVFPIIEGIINQKEKKLAKVLELLIRQICDYLLIDTEIIVSSNIEKNNELKGQEKVIEICKLLNASEYVNSIGGQTLYSQKNFLSDGIILKFLKTGEIQYQQFNKKFVSNLSIIDVMMFNSKEQIKEMLNNYSLIE